MNKPKLIHALLIFLVLFSGCIDPLLKPGLGYFPNRDDPRLFKRQYELNLNLASNASEFSKSLAYIHYMLARRYSIIYDTSDKHPTDSIKDAEAFVSNIHKKRGGEPRRKGALTLKPGKRGDELCTLSQYY
jgi:hypothetical protein